MGIKIIYQSIKQTIMAKVTGTKKSTVAKAPKPVAIKAPKNGLPITEQEWVEFAKKNKVKLPFFCIHGHDFTRRTSDGKAYLSEDAFKEDGGDITKIHGFELKK